jgi:hypothetical protein
MARQPNSLGVFFGRPSNSAAYKPERNTDEQTDNG